MPDIEEILALDLLTLREHTELAGDVLDADTQRRAIAQSLAISELATVRRAGALVAYAMLQPQDAGCWFVSGFNTHPAHRSAPVFRDLFAQIAALAAQHGIRMLRSNVYKTNRLSMAFHQKLGFKLTRENAKGVEFTAELAALKLSRPQKQNLLFVCSKNQWRSPTAEQVWRRHPGLSVRSAGTSHQARQTVSEDDVPGTGAAPFNPR